MESVSEQLKNFLTFEKRYTNYSLRYGDNLIQAEFSLKSKELF